VSGGLDIRIHTRGGANLRSEALCDFSSFVSADRALINTTPCGVQQLRVGIGRDTELLPTVAELLVPQRSSSETAPHETKHATPSTMTIPAPKYTHPIASTKCYMVTRGLEVGVFKNFHYAQSLTTGVPNAAWVKVASPEEGRAQFSKAIADGVVARIDKEGNMVVVKPDEEGEGGSVTGNSCEGEAQV
jgi:hypothetical protein